MDEHGHQWRLQAKVYWSSNQGKNSVLAKCLLNELTENKTKHIFKYCQSKASVFLIHLSTLHNWWLTYYVKVKYCQNNVPKPNQMYYIMDKVWIKMTITISWATVLKHKQNTALIFI